MKRKKFEKKLALNKNTVIRLDGAHLASVRGQGILTDDEPSCPGVICQYSDLPGQCVSLKFTNCEQCPTQSPSCTSCPIPC